MSFHIFVVDTTIVVAGVRTDSSQNPLPPLPPRSAPGKT